MHAPPASTARRRGKWLKPLLLLRRCSLHLIAFIRWHKVARDEGEDRSKCSCYLCGDGLVIRHYESIQHEHQDRCRGRRNAAGKDFSRRCCIHLVVSHKSPSSKAALPLRPTQRVAANFDVATLQDRTQ